MLTNWPSAGVWLCSRPTDMRLSFNGLSGLVRDHLGGDLVSDRWYVFVNRRRTMLKILGCEPGGLWVWTKRLERGCFAPAPAGVRHSALDRTRLLVLLDGIDMGVVRRRRRWVRPGG